MNVDRSKAQQLGLTQRDVTNSMLISLSSSGQVAPNQWLNPVNGVNYNVAVQTPDVPDRFVRCHAADADFGARRNGSTQLLGNLATFKRRYIAAIVNHYNVQPVYDIYANVDQRDLGGVANDIDKIMKDRASAEGRYHCDARPGGDHAIFISSPGHRYPFRHSAGLSADGREFSIVAGSVHHPDGAAGRAFRHSVDAVHHADYPECAVADGRDHVYRRGDGE